MKTKKLFIIVGSLFSLLGLGGCVKNPAPVVEGSRFESDFLFTNIVVPNEIGIFPAVYNDYIRDDKTHFFSRTGLSVLVYGDAYSSQREAYHEKFEELAKSLGDLPIHNGYSHVTPADNIVLSSALVGVSVQALSDYNKKYPKGSQLTDIVRISYESFDHVFPDLIPKAGDKKSLFSKLFPAMPLNPFTTIGHLRLGGVGRFEEQGGDKPARAIAKTLLELEFTEAPITPHQKFLVTLSLGDGQKFQREVEVDVVDHKPVV